MFQSYPKPQPIVLCGLELHRGRASGKKEGQETYDTMEPQGEKLCEAANISALLCFPHSLKTFLFLNTWPGSSVEVMLPGSIHNKTLDLSLSSPQQSPHLPPCFLSLFFCLTLRQRGCNMDVADMTSLYA